jgi:hypothetical protein
MNYISQTIASILALITKASQDEVEQRPNVVE